MEIWNSPKPYSLNPFWRRPNPEDVEGRRIENIYITFCLEMVCNIMKIMHCFLLILLRGMNFSIFTHFIIVRSGYVSFLKMVQDIQKFTLFRRFLINLDKDFPLTMYLLMEDPDPQTIQPTWNVKRVSHRDHCAIC